ncbi:ribosome biogenesis protein ytm1 [Rhizina undulata]
MSTTPMDIDGQNSQQQTQQVQVKFITRHADIAVPTAPILVPSNLKRLGLSQIINHLLDPETPIPFDFLIDGVYLRSSLENYLVQNGLSSESVITLEYVRAVVPPRFKAAFQHDDWISSVATASFNGAPNDARILSGSYDGIARVWNLSGQVVAEASGHSAAIKSISWLDSGARFVSAGIDRTLQIWSYAEDDSNVGTVTPIAELIGHKSTIEHIAVHPDSKNILSASADSTIGFWSTSSENSPPAPAELLPPKYKKRKTASAVPRYGAQSQLTGHTSPVSAVIFDPKDPTVAYSASWEHTLRTWDLPTSTLVDTRTTSHPLLSLCSLPSLSLLAAGTAARHITLHDPRASASTVSTSILRGHTNAVVSLFADPDSEWGLVSAGHDGTVRIWDVRATGSGSMFVINREGEGLSGKEKVFAVEWGSVGIVSAGEDKRVQINEVPKGAEKGKL